MLRGKEAVKNQEGEKEGGSCRVSFFGARQSAFRWMKNKMVRNDQKQLHGNGPGAGRRMGGAQLSSGHFKEG